MPRVAALYLPQRAVACELEQHQLGNTHPPSRSLEAVEEPHQRLVA